MKNMEQYFERVQSLIMGIPNEIERYDEQILSEVKEHIKSSQ